MSREGTTTVTTGGEDLSGVGWTSGSTGSTVEAEGVGEEVGEVGLGEDAL